jgi:hypothetical protein
VIVDVQMLGLLDPLTQFNLGGEARRLPEPLRQRGQHVWRQRQRLASRYVQGPHGVQAS